MKRILVHSVRHSGTVYRGIHKFAQKVWNGWRLNSKSTIFGAWENPEKAEPDRIGTLLP